MPKFTLPGHKYLGPGNPYPNGKPTNSADAIAKKHDKSYIDAQSENDILESDWKYTKEFAKDFINNPSVGSAAGTIGLGLKTGAERLIGVQYPNMSTIKRMKTSDISSSTGDGDTEMDVDEIASATSSATANARVVGASGSGHGAAALDSRATNIFQGTQNKPNYITIEEEMTYHFFTSNPLPSYQKVAQTGAQNVLLNMNYIQNIPVDRLRLYLSPRREAMLREQFSEVNCESVDCQVFSLGARGQFSTGGTGVTNANMQLQPFIAQFVGIEKDYPTECSEAAIQTFLGKLEGSNPYTIADAPAPTATIPNFPARSGSRSISCPLTVVYPNPFSFANNTAVTATSAVENQLSWPNIYEYAVMKNGAVLSEGSPTFSYHYKPKNKYLFGRNNFTRAEAFIAASAAIQPFTLLQTNNEIIMRTQDTQGNISGGSGVSQASNGNYVNAFNLQPRDVRIENQYQHNSTEMFKPHRMPRFLIGVMPLRNIGDNSNQDIQWEFLMKTKIVLRCQIGVKGQYGHTMTLPEPKFMYPNIQKGAYGNFGATSGGADTGTQIGPFSDRRNVFGRATFAQATTTAIPQGQGSTSNGIVPAAMVTRSKRALMEKEAEKNKQKD
jgi:Phospholipase A2-like domain